MIRAGRGRAAYRVAMFFIVIFALCVQYFLFRWPGWMYSYLVPETSVALGWVSPAFFIAVVGAGAAGAAVSLHVIRAGKMGWAVANMLFGLGAWALIWIVTWDQYFRVGTYESYHAGLAPPVREVVSFQHALNIVGAIQVIVGFGAAVWLVSQGIRARRLARIQPDPSPIEWRDAGQDPGAATPAPSIIEGGMILGKRPIDGGPLEPLAATPLAEIRGIVERAREAQYSWSLRSVEERAEILRQAGKRLLARAEVAADLLEMENGRPKAESYLSEIVPSADLFAYWSSKGALLLQGDDVPVDPMTFPGKRGVVERIPRGVVGAISPWNFPLMLPLRTVVPALLAGNAVILKPSEHGARVGAFLAGLFDGLLPDDVLAVVQGGGEVAQAILEVGVDTLVFIGSPRTGRAVARACAETLTPLTLELGGKDAAIVLEDADLERTANGVIWGAFANAGQNCAAIERCYVVEAVAEPFIAALRQRLASLRSGPGGEGEVDVGPLSTPAQRRIVDAQLAEAHSRGVECVGAGDGGQAFGVGGQSSKVRSLESDGGLHVPPILVIDPPEDLELLTHETFGPVLPIIRVKDEEEAARRANASPYGLTLSVWSRNITRAERLGRRIHTGVITINNHAFTGGLAQAPWGGVRGSGFGVTNSPQALKELTRTRFILVDSSRSKRELWWYPYDAGVLRLARGLTRLRSGTKGKLGALADLAGGFTARRRRRPK